MERVLITGGAGYIGSILTPTLLDAGYAVTVLDNFSHRVNSLSLVCANRNFQVARGDCRDEKLVKALMKDADIIIPLAALVGAPLCAQDPYSARTVNFEAVKLIVDAATPDQRIIFPVTNSGYGIGKKDSFCDENSPLNPISLYGQLKVDAEKLVMSHANAVSFRLATVFGMAPKMRIDLLVNDFTYRAVRDRSLIIFEGHFKRNYIHVRDVALGFLHALKNFDEMRGEVYNMGLSDANLSKVELAQRIQRFIPAFHYIEAAIGEDPDKRDYIVSNEKLEATGWRPQHSLDDGIEELIKGYVTIRNEIYTNVG